MFGWQRRTQQLVCLGQLGLLALACNGEPSPQPQPNGADASPPGAPAPVAIPTAAPNAPRVHEHVTISQSYLVDRIYKSMRGPESAETVTLGEDGAPELVWIVGFEATMVEDDRKTPASQEFMCHTNLDIDANAHAASFGGTKRLSGRLFTISQGQSRIDLPRGFGIPVLSTEPIGIHTQVLNLNQPAIQKKVRHRVTIRYVRDSEFATPLAALFPAAAYGLKLLRGADGVHGAEGGGHGEHGPSCLPGANAGTDEYVDDTKRRAFTGHWVVKPGREVNRTRVTEVMDLPFDTKLHYVAVHLHPFAESLELRDLTSKGSLFLAHTRQTPTGIGLDHVDHFTSEAGVSLTRGHEYELVSVYDNPRKEDQDSMAVMNLYLADTEFKKPDVSAAHAAMRDALARDHAADAPAGQRGM